MDVFECIHKRRSIRKFAEKPIDRETIEQLIDAARMAPSAGNVQDWFFVVVQKEKIKQNLARAALNQAFIAQAPVVVVYFADMQRIERSYGSRGKNLYAFQDSGAAIQNLLLAAKSLGLGSCWVGAINERKVEQILNAPKNFRALAIIPIGYPKEKPKPRKRREITEISTYEKFS